MCKVDVQVSLERSNFVHNDRLLAYINERSKKENNNWKELIIGKGFNYLIL